MEKNIYCIVGKSGSGKSYYMNAISSDTKFMKKANLAPLVYGTTRDKRVNEVDGVDYNFITEEEYKAIPSSKLIESRSYNTITGKKYYFTKSDYIENAKANLICTASLYQYEYYRSWINLKNLTASKSTVNEPIYNLHLIIIETELRNRLERILQNRCNTETDIYEACRRIVEERAEFTSVEERVPEFKDPFTYKQVIIIDNNDISEINTVANLEKIKKFILKE